MTISEETGIKEIAARVSQALADAGIDAVLSGGGAVTLYAENEYISADLDFITTERRIRIAPVVERLGFTPRGKDYVHAHSKYFIEFPSGPLAFGDRYVDSSETTSIETPFGTIRIITPTQCVMDRLAWYVHGNDKQALEQAIIVARRQEIDWDQVLEWAASEALDSAVVDNVRAKAG